MHEDAVLRRALSMSVAHAGIPPDRDGDDGEVDAAERLLPVRRGADEQLAVLCFGQLPGQLFHDRHALFVDVHQAQLGAFKAR